MNDLAFHMLMDVDKLDFNKELFKYKENVDFLILDRFILSNLVFAKANKVDVDWVKSFQSKIIKPDLTIIIDIPVEESFIRRPKRQDNFEKDKLLLETVRKEYIKTDETDESTFLIDGNGSVEEVSEGINELVKLVFGI